MSITIHRISDGARIASFAAVHSALVADGRKAGWFTDTEERDTVYYIHVPTCMVVRYDDDIAYPRVFMKEEWQNKTPRLGEYRPDIAKGNFNLVPETYVHLDVYVRE